MSIELPVSRIPILKSCFFAEPIAFDVDGVVPGVSRVAGQIAPVGNGQGQFAVTGKIPLIPQPLYMFFQVSVLSEQVGAQKEKIKDLETVLALKRNNLTSTEELLQDVSPSPRNYQFTRSMFHLFPFLFQPSTPLQKCTSLEVPSYR